jgi:hypothetical protein
MLNLRRVRPILSIVAALCVVLPASASGAVTVGQTGNTGSPCAGSGYTQLQEAVAAPPTYVMPTGGVITSWSHAAGSGAFEMRLKVYRRTGVTDQFLAVGQSGAEEPASNELQTFSARVAVNAGDLLGLSIVSGTGTSACLFGTAAGGDRTRQAVGDPPVGSTVSGPWNDGSSLRVNISALLEPDADADGFGDESQDQCPTDASTQGDCTPPETTITKGAPNKTKKHTVKFKFTSSEPGSSFECKLDKKKFKPCKSPRKYKRLKKGKHKFKVRAIDAAGNTDRSPAKDKFKVVR